MSVMKRVRLHDRHRSAETFLADEVSRLWLNAFLTGMFSGFVAGVIAVILALQVFAG